MSIITKYQDGLSGPEIAEKYNISKSTVYYQLKKAGVSARQPNEFKPKHDLNIEIFNPLNKIGAYYLGLLFADGCIYTANQATNRNAISLKLAVSDKELVESWANDIGYPFWHIYPTNRKNSQDSAICSISNRPLANAILEYLGRNEFYKKNLPIVPDKLMPHFVRGLLDGDGYIGIVRRKDRKSNIPRLDFSFQYLNVAEQFVKAIKRLTNIKLNGPYSRSTIYTVMGSYNKARKVADWIYDNPIRRLDRKYKIYKLF